MREVHLLVGKFYHGACFPSRKSFHAAAAAALRAASEKIFGWARKGALSEHF